MNNRPSRFLITTADERTWRADNAVLCLGDWCCLYDRTEAWKELRAEVLPYHWDDRTRLLRDYAYLRDLHEVLLRELSDALNAQHGTQHSRRYWRILVGPWLVYFTQMLFDRWTGSKQAVRDFEIPGTIVLELPPDQVIPKDMIDFRNMYPADPWNHVVYGKILTGWTNVPCARVPAEDGWAAPSPVIPQRPPTVAIRLRRGVSACLSWLSRYAGRPTDALMIATFLPRRDDLLLHLALGQVPKLHSPTPAPQLPPDLRLREEFHLNSDGLVGFEHCVRKLIPEQIPTVYLEGYRSLLKTAEEQRWPSRPRVLFTSNGYLGMEVFKAFAASKVDEGTPLLIGQHGGNLGSALWNSTEDHELAIADRYITWGWSNGASKHHPVGVLNRKARDPGKWDPQGNLLLVTANLPRYSYVLESKPVAVAQAQSHLNGQFRFVGALDPALRERLLVRLFLPDWGWSQRDRWRHVFPDVTTDAGSGPMEPLIRQCRLYVATYNGTSFLESLTRNIPTVVFWNPHHYELRPSAEPYFGELRKVGIFHESPENAASAISNVWEDVTGWWNQREVQEARAIFCNRFARNPRNLIKELRDAIITLVPEKLPPSQPAKKQKDQT